MKDDLERSRSCHGEIGSYLKDVNFLKSCKIISQIYSILSSYQQLFLLNEFLFTFLHEVASLLNHCSLLLKNVT